VGRACSGFDILCDARHPAHISVSTGTVTSRTHDKRRLGSLSIAAACSLYIDLYSKPNLWRLSSGAGSGGGRALPATAYHLPHISIASMRTAPAPTAGNR